MLPGVELARRRRVHHHDVLPRGMVEPSVPRRPPTTRQTGEMEERALTARRRLEGKLRRSVDPPSSPPRSSSLLPRWIRHVVGEGERSKHGLMGKKAHTRKDVLERRDSRIDLCAVCLDVFQAQQRVMWLPCSHKYHSDCLLPWLATHLQCPCCRTVVSSLCTLL